MGNKSDFRDGSIDSRAEVSKDEGQRMAADLGLTYFEVSAVSEVVDRSVPPIINMSVIVLFLEHIVTFHMCLSSAVVPLVFPKY